MCASPQLHPWAALNVSGAEAPSAIPCHPDHALPRGIEAARPRHPSSTCMCFFLHLLGSGSDRTASAELPDLLRRRPQGGYVLYLHVCLPRRHLLGPGGSFGSPAPPVPYTNSHSSFCIPHPPGPVQSLRHFKETGRPACC